MSPKKTPATSASPPKAAGSPKPAAEAAKSAPKAAGASKAVHDYSGIPIHKRVTAIVEKHDKANMGKVKPMIEKFKKDGIRCRRKALHISLVA